MRLKVNYPLTSVAGVDEKERMDSAAELQRIINMAITLHIYVHKASLKANSYAMLSAHRCYIVFSFFYVKKQLLSLKVSIFIYTH